MKTRAFFKLYRGKMLVAIIRQTAIRAAVQIAAGDSIRNVVTSLEKAENFISELAAKGFKEDSTLIPK